jgi:phosphate acetyltransferase
VTFTDQLEARAAPLGRRIAFPEGDDPRVAAAVELLSRTGVVEPVLVEGEGASQATPGALQRAATMLSDGEVDGVVAGAAHTTAQVIRTALDMVGLRDGVRTLSSSFFMEVRGFRGEGTEVLTFTDAAVVPAPGTRRLVEIAAEAVRLRRLVVGDEPRVAFLSYSTLGSAGGRSVEMVREAVGRFRESFPDVAADGELQADAALVPEVARGKAPGSSVAGTANILVFPSLDAANIAYKLVQRLAGAVALGPILQGLRAPVNDLSRGASVSDIVRVAAITALMVED